MAAQVGLCLAWSETFEDTFSRGAAQIYMNVSYYLCFQLLTFAFVCYIHVSVFTVYAGRITEMIVETYFLHTFYEQYFSFTPGAR